MAFWINQNAITIWYSQQFTTREATLQMLLSVLRSESLLIFFVLSFSLECRLRSELSNINYNWEQQLLLIFHEYILPFDGRVRNKCFSTASGALRVFWAFKQCECCVLFFLLLTFSLFSHLFHHKHVFFSHHTLHGTHEFSLLSLSRLDVDYVSDFILPRCVNYWFRINTRIHTQTETSPSIYLFLALSSPPFSFLVLFHARGLIIFRLIKVNNNLTRDIPNKASYRQQVLHFRPFWRVHLILLFRFLSTKQTCLESQMTNLLPVFVHLLHLDPTEGL